MADSGVDYRSLPFEEQIQFFRDKLRLPTRTWTDIHHGMHARAFVVAGATRDDLLADFQSAVDKAIAQGTTLETFRKDFDRIVATYGWSYNGDRDWRSNVIYSTNIRTAYMAARYKQMTDPDLLATRPYWQYRHGDSRVPRPDHLSWDGLVLRWDDPWWDVHFPPNGWGCSCTVFSLSEEEVNALGDKVRRVAPPTNFVEKKLGSSPDAPTVMVPEGVDPGWGYNVGQSAWGKPHAEATMEAWRAEGGQYRRLTPGDFDSAARADRVPLDRPGARMAADPDSVGELTRLIAEAIGGDAQAFAFPGAGGALVNVDAAVLAEHLPLDLGRFVPWLPETFAQPYEVWLAFEEHEATGQVVLRQRIVKGFETGDGRGAVVTAQAMGGQLEALQVRPADDVAGVNLARVGKLRSAR